MASAAGDRDDRVTVAPLDWNGDLHAQLVQAVAAAHEAPQEQQQNEEGGQQAAAAAVTAAPVGSSTFAGFDVVLGSDLAFFRNNAKTGDAPRGLVAAVRAALRVGGRLVHMGPCRPPRRNKIGGAKKVGQLAQGGGAVDEQLTEQLAALNIARSRHAAYFGGLCGEGGIGAVELSAFGWTRTAALQTVARECAGGCDDSDIVAARENRVLPPQVRCTPSRSGGGAVPSTTATTKPAAAAAERIPQQRTDTPTAAAAAEPPKPEPGAGGVAEMVCVSLLRAE